MDPNLRQELRLTLLLLGADPMLLGAIDAVGDRELIADLRNWNEAKLAELQEWLPTMSGEELETTRQRIEQYESQRRSLKEAA